MASEGLSHAVDRLVEIKAELSRLGEEKAALEAKLLKAAQEDLRDTKRKSVSYGGGLGRATAVMADSVKLVYPSLLRKIFGPVYEDAVTVKCDAKLTAPAARLLARALERELQPDRDSAGDRTAPLRGPGEGAAEEEAQGNQLRNRPQNPHSHRRL